MGENLVWESPVRVGSHHYARIFLEKGNSVFWVSLPWSPFHLLKGFKYERIKQWNKGRVKDYGNGLRTFCPLTFLPYRNNFPFRNIFFGRNTLKFSFPSFRKILESIDFSEVDILWLTDPRFIALTEYVTYRHLIYRCVDDLATFSNVAPNIVKLEREIVDEADIVFATAKRLVEKLKKWRNDVVFLPNGVDLGNFVRQEHSQPDEIKHIPHPRVIYVGTVGPWFDSDLIAAAARQLENVNFILVGPVQTNCGVLETIDNVWMIGTKDFKRVPDFLKFSDAAIIPFVKNDLSDAVNPIKLYEYFSVGLPVVATDILEVTNMNSPAIVGETKDGFVEGIKKALAEGKDRPEYFSFAENNSWQKRYKAIGRLIEQL